MQICLTEKYGFSGLHITSPTAITLPIAELVWRARRAGTLALSSAPTSQARCR